MAVGVGHACYERRWQRRSHLSVAWGQRIKKGATGQRRPLRPVPEDAPLRIKAHRLRVQDGRLAIPMQAAGKLHSLRFIGVGIEM